MRLLYVQRYNATRDSTSRVAIVLEAVVAVREVTDGTAALDLCSGKSIFTPHSFTELCDRICGSTSTQEAA